MRRFATARQGQGLHKFLWRGRNTDLTEKHEEGESDRKVHSQIADELTGAAAGKRASVASKSHPSKSLGSRSKGYGIGGGIERPKGMAGGGSMERFHTPVTTGLVLRAGRLKLGRLPIRMS